jgi:bacillithiol biosynthesis deacetylase BshB1
MLIKTACKQGETKEFSMRVLACAPHPDDAELHCGGTLASLVAQGHCVAIVDCTRGEMGSRGSVATRANEVTSANQALGIPAEQRFNLALPDGFLNEHLPELQRNLVALLRTFQPDLVLAMPQATRHPDHHALANTISPALKAAALHKWPDQATAAATQVLSKPVQLLRYEAEDHITPTIIQAINLPAWEAKMAAIAAFHSQFTATADGPQTSITQTGFLDGIAARGRYWGQQIGAPYGEAFQSDRCLGCADIAQLTYLGQECAT